MSANPGQTATLVSSAPKKMGRFNQFDTPWFNIKLIIGVILVGSILLMGVIGPYLRDIDLAYVGRGPLNLPPVGFENMRGEVGDPAHPLGTDNSGRDMLSLIIIGAPNSLMVASSRPASGCWRGFFWVSPPAFWAASSMTSFA